jgi:hypothetical protein
MCTYIDMYIGKLKSTLPPGGGVVIGIQKVLQKGRVKESQRKKKEKSKGK